MVYHGNKKSKGRSPGQHPYTNEDMKRVGWCLKRGISVVVSPNWKGGVDEWRVEIRINGKTHADPSVYNGYDALEKMYEYYKYYYDRSKR